MQTQHKLVVQLHEQYSTINVIHVRKICKSTLKILLFPDFFQRLKFSLTRSEILNFFCSSPITSLWPNSQSFTTCGGMKVHDSLRRFFYSHSQSIPVHAHVVKNELIRSLFLLDHSSYFISHVRFFSDKNQKASPSSSGQGLS